MMHDSKAVLLNGVFHTVNQGLMRCTQAPPPPEAREIVCSGRAGTWIYSEDAERGPTTKAKSIKPWPGSCEECRDAAYRIWNPEGTGTAPCGRASKV